MSDTSADDQDNRLPPEKQVMWTSLVKSSADDSRKVGCRMWIHRYQYGLNGKLAPHAWSWSFAMPGGTFADALQFGRFADPWLALDGAKACGFEPERMELVK